MKNLLIKMSEHGWIYVFFDGASEGNSMFKLGKAKDLNRRMRQWDQRCPNTDRIWLEAFWTPKAILTGISPSIWEQSNTTNNIFIC